VDETAALPRTTSLITSKHIHVRKPHRPYTRDCCQPLSPELSLAQTMMRVVALLMLAGSSSATLRLWAKKDFDPISSPMVESNQDCHCEEH
jgi:hypothetical protein